MNNRIGTIIFLIVLISGIIFLVIKLNQSTPEYLYGPSLRQNKLVNTIRLHRYGITGKNVTIGLIDAGFYTKHSVFENTRIVKEYDFVRDIPKISVGKSKGQDHGTNVFSVVGGYEVNKLIGIAYGANFMLARTDISSDRLVQEEKNAIEASKWMYENGADIISTSLSFKKFDNADYYYPYQMDGKSAEITRTADSLVGKGILYFSSAGNSYEEDWKIIEPPSDGYNVLAVGSIDKNRNHSFFSSSGPTVDGRIKPDIVAPGEGVWVANHLPTIKPDFSWSHGTSLSAPIAAGIAALVLSTHPGLSSKEIIEAIKSSSSLSNNPNNLMGWGIPDAEKAVSYFGPAFSNIPQITETEDGCEVRSYVFSSFGIIEGSVKLQIDIDDGKQIITKKMIQIDEGLFSCSFNWNKNSAVKLLFIAKDKRGRITKYPYEVIPFDK